MSELQIGLVELPATRNADPFGDRINDVYSFMKYPPRGLPTLHGIAHARGFGRVRSIHPESNGHNHLTAEEFEYLAGCDVVGISAITRTFPQSMELGRRLKARNPEIRLIIGGQHATEDAATALSVFDVVVHNEGDHTFPEVLERMQQRDGLEGVLGISYKRDGSARYTGNRPFLTPEQLSELPFPLYDPRTLENITNMTFTTSRGCPFTCTFCSVIKNFGNTFRMWSDDSILELAKYLTKIAPNLHFFWGDDIWNGNPGARKRLAQRIRREGFHFPKGFAQVRIEIGKDDELLDMAYNEYHIRTMAAGLESINPETLRQYQKRAQLKEYERLIDAIRSKGIRMHGMFVLGGGTDTPGTVRETLAFASEHCDTTQFFSLTPVTGTPLGLEQDRSGVIVSYRHDRHDALNAVIAPERMTSYELMMENGDAFRAFYNPWNWRNWKRAMQSPHPLFVLASLFIGRSLVKKIEVETAEYVGMLKDLHPWQQRFLDYFQQWDEEVCRIAMNGVSPAEKEQNIRDTTERYLRIVSEDPGLVPMEGEFGQYTREGPRKLLQTRTEQYLFMIHHIQEAQVALEKHLEHYLQQHLDSIAQELTHPSRLPVIVDNILSRLQSKYEEMKKRIPPTIGIVERLKPACEHMFETLRGRTQELLQPYVLQLVPVTQ